MNIGIKNVKPTLNSPYKQGYFKPMFPNKYIGSYPIIFRSSWERKFAIYCDTHSNIVFWASEMFAIKYYNIIDKKYHTYYPDFYIKVKTENGYKEYIVEVKPSAQLSKPIEPKINNTKAWLNYKKAKISYIINICKSNALKEFARNRNYEVLYVTEKSSFI